MSAVVWTIAGEAGKAWDATSVSMEARGVSAGTVAIGSIDADKITLTQVVRDRENPPAKPDHKQRVTLYRDGVAYFRGWATSSKISLGSSTTWTRSIEISGVWWHWKNTPMVGTVNHAAYSSYAERNQFVAPYNQQLNTSIANLVAAYNKRFAAGDARRVALVLHSTAYQLMEITLSNTDFLTGLSELTKYCPDMVGWWDNAAATPTLHFARRADCTARALALGEGSIVTSAEFNERTDLDGSDGVRIDYAELDPATGEAVYKSQSSSGAGANCQVVTVSGPELGGIPVSVTTTTNTATTSTATVTDNTAVKSVYLTTTAISWRDAWAATLPGVAEIAGYSYLSPGEATWGSDFVCTNEDKGGSIVAKGNACNGTKLGDQNLPSWVDDELLAAGYFPFTSKVRWTIGYRGYYNISLAQTTQYPWGYFMRPSSSKNASGQYYWNTYALTEGAWRFYSAATLNEETVNLRESPYNLAASPLSFEFAKVTNAFLEITCKQKTVYPEIPNRTFNKPSTSVSVSSTSSSTSTSSSKYEYAKVPTGLAGNLASAQNWTPMEGTVKLRSDSPAGTLFSGCRVTVSGGPSEWLTMTALVKSQSTDLFTGRETVSCGVPTRFGAVNLVKKLSTNSESNIVYL